MKYKELIPNAEDVAALYKYLLYRDVDSTDRVNELLSGCSTLEDLVSNFINCDEFKQKNKIKNISINGSKLGIIESVNRMLEKQETKELYQPIYGCPDIFSEYVQRDCVSRVDLVLNTFSSHKKNNMTVLDVGCNLGYISFSLAPHFFKVTGVEYFKEYYEICNEINKCNNQICQFFFDDFFANYKLEIFGADVCLLFSVTHYLVASRGLSEAKSVFADICHHYNYLIVETSTPIDYPYMPSNPEEIFEEVKTHSVNQIGVSEKNNRPIYLLVREFDPYTSCKYTEKTTYSDVRNNSYSRIAHTDSSIIKMFPMSDNLSFLKFRNEINVYNKMIGSEYVPELFESGSNYHNYYISIQNLHAPTLTQILTGQTGERRLTDKEKVSIAARALLFNIELLKQGVFWNDLTSHNIVMSYDGCKFIDFAEASFFQSIDHVVLYTWLIGELQTHSSLLPKLTSALMKSTRGTQRSLTFVCDFGQLHSDLAYLYNLALELNSWSDLVKIHPEKLQIIKRLATY